MQLLGDMGISQQEITAFRENLLGSQQPSVDAFLEYRPEFEKVGKAAMAMILLPAEDASKSRLFPEGTQHWYENNSKFGNLPGPTAMGCPGGMLGDGPKIGRNRGIMAAPGRPRKQAIRGRLA